MWKGSRMKRLLARSIEEEKLKLLHIISNSLTENDILELEDKFLSKGFQYIKVKNIKQGRSLINVFLESLNCYKNPALLTVSSEPMSGEVVDLYEKIQSNPDNMDWGEFLLEEFFYDFLWIEATKDLLKNDWFSAFEQKIEDFRIDKEIPILVVVYK